MRASGNFSSQSSHLHPSAITGKWRRLLSGRRSSNFPHSDRPSRRGNLLGGPSHLRRLTRTRGKCSGLPRCPDWIHRVPPYPTVSRHVPLIRHHSSVLSSILLVEVVVGITIIRYGKCHTNSGKATTTLIFMPMYCQALFKVKWNAPSPHHR